MDTLRRTGSDITRRIRSAHTNLTSSPSPSASTSPSTPSREKDTPPARLVIAADVPEEQFDGTIKRRFRDEGFDVAKYVQVKVRSGGGEGAGWGGGGNVDEVVEKEQRKEVEAEVHRVEDDLEAGERYAVVAYNTAASLLLDICTKPMPKLCALVAYYPSTVPSSAITANNTTAFPPSLQVVIHLAGTQNFAPRDNAYFYPDADVGFAEHQHPNHQRPLHGSGSGSGSDDGGDEGKDNYDKVSARLAWSRTLACLRKGFGIDVSSDVEEVWERHLRELFVRRDVDGVMATMVDDHYGRDGKDRDGLSPYVNYVPTMIGGSGRQTLHQLYTEEFLPHVPPSLQLRLLSRTVGTDRLVDELLLSFRHTQEIPWLLPHVPPTDCEVSVVLVAVVTVRGGKIAREHVYWDQASVLVQVGLLDPGFVPAGFKATGRTVEGEEGVRRVPVVGGKGVRKVVDEESEESNGLLIV